MQDGHQVRYGVTSMVRALVRKLKRVLSGREKLKHTVNEELQVSDISFSYKIQIK